MKHLMITQLNNRSQRLTCSFYKRAYNQSGLLELEAKVDQALEEFVKQYLNEETGEFDLDRLEEDIINEGLLGSIIGGLTGFALGKSVGKMLAKVLGIQKGIFYDLLTSRLVGAALGAAFGKRF